MTSCCFILVDKPGTCPRDRYVRELTRVTDFCSHECSGDVDCPEYKKCCVRFCSRVCVDPERESIDKLTSWIVFRLSVFPVPFQFRVLVPGSGIFQDPA